MAGSKQPQTDPQAAAAEASKDAVLRSRMARIGRKLLVLSGKGGVGKSTIAVYLAVSLARAGKRVGLLDVDVHGPSIPKLLGLEGRGLTYDAQGLYPLQVSENLSVISIGFLLPSDSDAVIWRGPRKYGVIRQFLEEVEWGELDYLIIDSPPGTGDEPLSVAQLVGDSAGAVLVTTPQDVSVSDVRRSASFCRAVHLPIVGIIENMSGLVCPRCGERIDVFKRGGGEALARELGVELLCTLPIDPTVVARGDDPARASAPEPGEARGPAAEALDAAVKRIVALDEGPPAAPGDSARGDPASAAAEQSDSKGYTMKIAIPLAGEQLSPHFGHCEEFALFEADPGGREIVATQRLSPPAHEPGVLPRWLHEHGAEVIIAGGMGRRAQQLFAENGIKVVVGAARRSPEELVSDYLAGALETGQNLCDH